MRTVRKARPEIVKKGFRTGIVRALKKQYGSVVQEKLPAGLTALLALYESTEAVSRIKAKLEQLRLGLKNDQKGRQ
jgi:hypothetical protein